MDSSGWIALYNRRDANHSLAAGALSSLIGQSVRLVTSDYIVDETLTHLRAWGGHHVAVAIGTVLLDHPLLDWVHVDRAVWAAAWDIFVKYDDQPFSFTDCTSFAIMRNRTIREAFAFDTDYERMGFALWPGASESR